MSPITTSDKEYLLFQEGAMEFRVCGLTIARDGTIRTWNDGAEKVFAYTSAEITGQPHENLFPADEQQQPRILRETANSKNRSDSSGWRLGKNGKTVYVNSILTAVKDDDGQIAFYSEVIRDQTDRKEAEEKLASQQHELNELSTPVLQLWHGILALPIIGTLDSARSQIVMERLLHELVVTGSSIAILDISGVPTVDTEVAKYLMNTVSATRLMGAQCIISGVRPEIAQTMVHLGVDLSTIKTKASMARALEYGLSLLGTSIHKNGKEEVATAGATSSRALS